ncbi:DUF1700 domain-containing protein [Neobacillus sp. PS3-34]|uniref:HAAS signaling domain-containing protein n=1 Tax=Neobacillus sp. PS3-34 TaxID=3070678 RepID=UPI0027DFEDC1|nr:DUF1700 domain-containing protein [Neobacillus sp. PS3-34]WML50223.1 DUF1700 domain-containing protein [Neobacillus sp. PS3-34]
MANNEFISKLEALLKKVPEPDRKEMLYDYEEHFEIGLDSGKSKTELIEELGDPQVIARDLLADYRIGKAETDKSASNIFHAIIATISLSFFNLIFIIGQVAGIFGAYVALCAVSFAFTISPLAIFSSFIFGYSYESFATNFFVSLSLCSLGLLMSIGMIYVGRFFYNIILRYIKFNLNIIKGDKGEKAA